MVQRITVGEPNVRTVYQNDEGELVDPDEYDGDDVEEVERENYPQFIDASDSLMKRVQTEQANSDELLHPLEVLGRIFIEESNPDSELVYYFKDSEESEE